MNLFEQAQAHLKVYKLSEALECCEQFEDGEEKSKLRHRILACQEARNLWNESYKQSLLGRDYILGLGRVYNRKDRGRNWTRATLKQNPDKYLEELTKAIALIEKINVVDLFAEPPSNEREILYMNINLIEPYLWRAEIYLDKGDYNKSIKDCTRVLDTIGLEMYGKFTAVIRAEAYLKKGCYDKAIEDCESLMSGSRIYLWLMLCLICAEAYFEKAKASLQNGDCAGAKEYCNKALEVLNTNDWSQAWELVTKRYSYEDSWDYIEYQKLEQLKVEIANFIS
ncbi:MAG: hypothetical protein FWC26_10330 [Fibromonadales bacterium]|nr:hypothetical protein [Fibromonadales bacterium]